MTKVRGSFEQNQKQKKYLLLQCQTMMLSLYADGGVAISLGLEAANLLIRQIMLRRETGG